MGNNCCVADRKSGGNVTAFTENEVGYLMNLYHTLTDHNGYDLRLISWYL